MSHDIVRLDGGSTTVCIELPLPVMHPESALIFALEVERNTLHANGARATSLHLGRFG